MSLDRAPGLRLAREVIDALAAGGPAVVLESAVFSHGLPAEHVPAAARALDSVVRASGATPALVAVRDGIIEVGLDAGDVGFLLAAGVLKAAERDLAVAVAGRMSAGTTVSATLAVAARVGLRVLATGGIGGVHRGVGEGDVSADLAALGRHPLVVICAGPKAICDPLRTMEMLEALGVTVVGYRTDTVPAFLSRSTGVPVPHRVDDPRMVAALAEAKESLADRAALLVMQPPPPEAAMEAQELDDAMAWALDRARAEGATGGTLTPYLLARLAEASGGRSVRANLAVLEANAQLAAEVAVRLARPAPSP